MDIPREDPGTPVEADEMIGQLAKTPVTYERVTDMGESMGFKVGHATVMDLTVGWDFTLSEHREIVREYRNNPLKF